MPGNNPRRMALAKRLGYSIKRTGAVEVNGAMVPRFELDTGTNERAISLFTEFGRDDGRNDPEVVAVANSIMQSLHVVHDRDRDRLLATAIHRWVRDHVTFQREEVETNYTGGVTIAVGSGDCDDHSSLVVGLATACGLPAKVVGIRGADGDIGHACAQILVDGQWLYAETTVAARLGEHPYDAAVRTGVIASRPDIGAKS